MCIRASAYIRRQKLCVERIQCKRKDEEYDEDDGRVQGGRGGGGRKAGRDTERRRREGERETESEKETWRSNGHPRFPF